MNILQSVIFLDSVKYPPMVNNNIHCLLEYLMIRMYLCTNQYSIYPSLLWRFPLSYYKSLSLLCYMHVWIFLSSTPNPTVGEPPVRVLPCTPQQDQRAVHSTQS